MFYLIDLERTIGSGIVHYWKGDRRGYTRDIKEAGLYSEYRANEFVKEDFDKRTIKVDENVAKKILKDI